VMTFIEGVNEIGRLSSEMKGIRSCLYFVSFAHFVVRQYGTIYRETLEMSEIELFVYKRRVPFPGVTAMASRHNLAHSRPVRYTYASHGAEIDTLCV